MRRHKKGLAVFGVAALLMLSGCAENQIPDLTEDEMQSVSQYVAITMMKYDLGHSSRLMDLSEAGASYTPGVTAPSPSPNPEESVGMAPVDDTPIVDSEGQEVKIENNYTMEEVMGLPEGVSVTYLGYEMYASYPEDSDFFSVTAPEGNKVFVLRFSLTNTSGEERSVDLMSSRVTYRITLNGNYTRNALTTGLLEDLSTYKDTIQAGGSVETVLLIQVEEETAEEISSVGIIIKNDTKSYKTIF